MKILVAGGAGFIGSHLVDRLIALKHQVHVVDNLVTGRMDNIAHLSNEKNFKFFNHDIVEEVPNEAYDRIYNMASPASPIDFAKIPIEIMLTGSIGHKNLLDLAGKCNARILFASTSEVYGDPLVNPQPETYYGNVNCIGARSCYDEAKRFGEALSMSYHKKLGVNTRIVRIFNTYGPRMAPGDGRVIPNFFMQALRGKGLSVYGDGQQTRSLCYVSDMVEGLIALMESDVVEPVNIGNSIEMTILEIGSMINKLTGNTAKFITHPLPENDPKLRQPDTTRAKKYLNWSAKVSPEEGLRMTMAYFQKL